MKALHSILLCTALLCINYRIEAADGNELIAKTYDIRDILISIPKHFSTSDKAAEGDPGEDRQKLVREVITLIQDMVDSSTWIENGGTLGTITEAEGQLSVTHTVNTQAKVLHLLKLLREGRSVQVTTEIRFLSMNPELLAKIPKSPDQKEVWYLDDKQLVVIYDAVKADKVITMITAPRVTTFDGQSASVSVERPTHYVADVVPATQPNAEQKLNPVIDQYNSGIKLDLRATASSDRKSVILSINSSLSRLLSLNSSQSSDGNLAIQSVTSNTQKIDLTVEVPNGKTVVLGGLQSPVGIDKATGAPVLTDRSVETKQQAFYLLVKPHIIIQREIVAEEFPLVREKK